MPQVDDPGAGVLNRGVTIGGLMCLQCGCGLPYDDMGEPDKNIVVNNIKTSVGSEAAKGITTEQAIQNIVETWKKVKPEDKQFKAEG